MSWCRMGFKKIDDDDFIDDLSASAIDDEGIWHLSESGHSIDLRHVQLHLPDGKGHESVIGVILSPEGYYYRCPLCKEKLHEEGLIILLENHHYLVVRCCDKLLLYENNKLNLEAWI